MSDTAHLVHMFDSTVVRAHVSAAGAKGGKTIRRSAAHAVDFQPRFDVHDVPHASPAMPGEHQLGEAGDLRGLPAWVAVGNADMPEFYIESKDSHAIPR
jgi:hypothetical protein